MIITRHDTAIAEGRKIEPEPIEKDADGQWRMTMVAEASSTLGGQRKLASFIGEREVKVSRWRHGQTRLPDAMLEALAVIIDTQPMEAH